MSYLTRRQLKRWPVAFSSSVAEAIFADSDSPGESEEAYLVIRDSIAWREVFRLSPSTVATVGRETNNRIVVEDSLCSRSHCQIFHTNETWYVRDLNSRNGTKLNSRKIEGDHELRDGDRVRIGGTELLFTRDISQPLESVAVNELDSEDSGSIDVESVSADGSAVIKATVENVEPEILERKSSSRYITESGRSNEWYESGMRDAMTHLYGLIFQMLSAKDTKAVSEIVLDGLLSFVGADIGAVLLFPGGRDYDADPEELRIISYHSPEDTAYHRVSGRVSETVLREGEAVLAMQIGGTNDNEFQTLTEMNAKSVICAPIRREGEIHGLLHLYSLNASKQLDVDALEFTLAVADQLAKTLFNLEQRESLTTGLKVVCEENQSLRRLLAVETELVGNGQTMERLRETIARVSSSDAAVLVRGESGVGKELVASAIHFNSERKKGPFVCMNCAAITENLLESELFGHEKGAFTGATEQKIGKFERAHLGTIFLDEVGEMPLTVQAKFLRVLEGHPFERVGGSEQVSVDVRVVAATNRALEAAVEAGDFRKDLFFRLQILEVDVPPLRDHTEDLPELVDHFLNRCCERMKLSQLAVSEEAMHLLKEYEWPGNVRELRNVIERAVVLADGPEIGPECLRFSSLQGSESSVRKDGFEPVSLEELERHHIARTLKWTKWHKRETARILGINRSTLDRKLERYDIQSPDGCEAGAESPADA